MSAQSTSIPGPSSVPHMFKFQELDPSTTDCKQLEDLLQRLYGMPTQEWWMGAESRFDLLKRYFERDFNTSEGEIPDQNPTDNRGSDDILEDGSAGWEDSNFSNVASETGDRASQPNKTSSESESQNGRSREQQGSAEQTSDRREKITSPIRRETRHPKVKVFKASTFLMGITAVGEPLICRAFGTIAPRRYEGVFWETVAKIKDEEKVRLEVISIEFLTPQDVNFFLRLGRIALPRVISQLRIADLYPY
jgi:hypothetical protein